LVPQRIRDGIREIFRKLMAGDIEPVEYYEDPLLTKNGEERMIAFHNTVIRDPRGQIVGVLLSGEDITERKKAEDKIKHLNLVLRAIRSVNQLIAREMDPERLLQGACQNFIETQGYHNVWIALADKAGKITMTVEAGLGQDFSPLAEQLKRGELTHCGRKALEQTEVIVVTDPLSICSDCPLSTKYSGRGGMIVRLEHKGKVYGLLSTSISKDPIRDREEQSLFQEVAGDIAFALCNLELEEERKNAEQRIREYAQELTVKNEQLKVETKKAKESDQLKSEFLANMSYEIRTPLTVIKGAAYLLDKSSLSDEQRNLCNMYRA